MGRNQILICLESERNISICMYEGVSFHAEEKKKPKKDPMHSKSLGPSHSWIPSNDLLWFYSSVNRFPQRAKAGSGKSNFIIWCITHHKRSRMKYDRSSKIVCACLKFLCSEYTGFVHFKFLYTLGVSYSFRLHYAIVTMVARRMGEGFSRKNAEIFSGKDVTDVSA